MHTRYSSHLVPDFSHVACDILSDRDLKAEEWWTSKRLSVYPLFHPLPLISFNDVS